MRDDVGEGLGERLIRHVLILMAMRDEARPMIEALQLEPVEDALDAALPMRCYSGWVDGIRVSLGIAGVDARYDVDHIGSEAAGILALETLRYFQPDLLISAGTAGGFAALGADIGTVYLSERMFVFHDRHVPLDGFRQSAVGEYPALDVSAMAETLGLPTGVVSTGSSLQKSERDLQVIQQYRAVAKEMEAAAIAWVAMLYDVPMMAVKSITNLVDEENRSEAEFVKHFECASAALARQLIAVLRYLNGRRIGELAQSGSAGD